MSPEQIESLQRGDVVASESGEFALIRHVKTVRNARPAVYLLWESGTYTVWLRTEERFGRLRLVSRHLPDCRCDGSAITSGCAEHDRLGI